MTMPVVETLPLRTDEHGVIRVGRTRVTLDTVVAVWRQGATPEQIAQDFDTLALSDVYAAIFYYLLHRDEVEAYLERRCLRADEVRREVEARCPPEELRQRFLARLHRGVDFGEEPLPAREELYAERLARFG